MRKQVLLQCGRCRTLLLSLSSWERSSGTTFSLLKQHLRNPLSSSSSSTSSSSLCYFLPFPTTPISSFPFRSLNTKSSSFEDDPLEGEEAAYEWEEEEEETEPEIGDGGDGGGVVLGSVSWGEQVLRIAREVLVSFGDDVDIFAFKISPRGYIYVRLDKLSNKYGCPSIEEIEKFSCLYKRRLDEIGESGEIPSDLALEVSSPGAERLLKVPNDLSRFKEMPMRVCYLEEGEEKPDKKLEKDGVFLLERVETELQECVWKLANVKENRDVLGKGRPLSRKQKDWRLRLPFGSLQRVSLYIDTE